MSDAMKEKIERAQNRVFWVVMALVYGMIIGRHGLVEALAFGGFLLLMAAAYIFLNRVVAWLVVRFSKDDK